MHVSGIGNLPLSLPSLSQHTQTHTHQRYEIDLDTHTNIHTHTHAHANTHTHKRYEIYPRGSTGLRGASSGKSSYT